MWFLTKKLKKPTSEQRNIKYTVIEKFGFLQIDPDGKGFFPHNKKDYSVLDFVSDGPILGYILEALILTENDNWILARGSNRWKVEGESVVIEFLVIDDNEANSILFKNGYFRKLSKGWVEKNPDTHDFLFQKGWLNLLPEDFLEKKRNLIL